MSSSAKPGSSLQRQLLLWLLAPLLLLLVVNSIIGYRVAISTANAAYDRLLLASVKAIADRVTISGGEISVDIPYVALELFESNFRERIFYKVSAPDGSTLTGYEDLPAPPPGASTTKPTFFRSRYHEENVHQAALYKPVYDPTLRGMVLIQVAETGESREALSRRILYESLLAQGALITLAALCLGFGVRYALRPLLILRDSVSARAQTDLTPVDEAPLQSEVRPLVEALNQHTARIERIVSSRVKSVAAAAHQVRTRLSILRTQVELGSREPDEASLRAALVRTEDMIDEATRFFNQLLVLAHAEAHAIPGLNMDDVDLAASCHAVTLEWVAAARRKRINIGYEGLDAGVLIAGNRMLVRELLTNLVDNAIRYTPPGGAVTVRVLTDGACAIVQIEDDGAGIPPGERERVFERFYRSTSGESHGTGLGLPIAAEICRSHGAEIHLHVPPNGQGLLVELRFTCRAAPSTPALRAASA